MFGYNGVKGGGYMQHVVGTWVQLIYVDSKQQVSIRDVRVLAVGEKRLLAYCDTAKAVRTFMLDRIVDMEGLKWRLNAKPQKQQQA